MADQWLEEFSRIEATAPLLAPKVPASPLLNVLEPVKRKPKAVKPDETPPVEVYEDDEDTAKRWRITQWRELGLQLQAAKPIPNLSNVSLVLAQIKLGEIWYDEFLQKILTRSSEDDGTTREWTDADDIRLTMQVQSECGLASVSKATIRDAVVEHAYKDVRNELREYLEDLEWDGKFRIDRFFVDICGTRGSTYAEAVGRNFFLSLVARAFRPGCQMDYMVILEGKQGIYKSRLLRTLGGKWYAVMREAPISKDFEIALQGKWLIEIAELDSFGRGDVKAVKRALTTPVDRYRSPYGTHAADHPRQSVFAGTTNSQDWNTDATGARRFWPIECGPMIDISRAEVWRDQYFAEAYARFKKRERYWEMPGEETERQQRERFIDDPWTDAVCHYALSRQRISMAELLEHLGLKTENQDRRGQMRAGAILKMMGWKSKMVRSSTGEIVRRWVLEGPRTAQDATNDPGPYPGTPEEG